MGRYFNAPPAWPPPPPGWFPPIGWMPDPSWPPAPSGWRFWLNDHRDALLTANRTAANWAMGGAAAVTLGALLPFITIQDLFAIGDIRPEARQYSGGFGLLLLFLGVMVRFGPPQSWLSAILLALSGLGFLGYGGFMLIGLEGVQNQDPIFGTTGKLTFSPNIGLVLSIGGAATVALAAIRALRTTPPPNV
jgi:hypothetical protein